MKKIASLALVLILLISAIPSVLAEDNQEEVEAVEVEAGVTPDSPLWGLERAQERIKLALTFNRAEKAKLRLQNAEERLAEVQVMIQEQKLEQAEKAERAHKKDLADLETDLEELQAEDTEVELEQAVEIESLINGHQVALENLRRKVDRSGVQEADTVVATEAIEGREITAEERAIILEKQLKFQALLERFEQNAQRVATKAQEKTENAKTKMLAKGASEVEIEEIETEVEDDLEAQGKIRKEERVENPEEGEQEREQEREAEDDDSEDDESEDDEHGNQNQNQNADEE